MMSAETLKFPALTKTKNILIVFDDMIVKRNFSKNKK